MFAIAYDHNRGSRATSSFGGCREQVAQILKSRKRVMESRDILYCSPAIRTMVEDDIPILISLLLEER